MPEQLSYSTYLKLAIPFTVSTITQPLLGAVDTAVLGRMEDAAFMGGVAIGTIIFNTVYWLLGFLRVSTAGMSSQSLGTGREGDRFYSYLRPAFLAVIIGICFIVLRGPIKSAAFLVYQPSPDVAAHTVRYFDILIYGAPCVLLGYVNLGWLMGRKHVKESMFLQITMNGLNIVLDLILVLVLDKGVAGVAAATLLSQLYGCAVGFYLLSRHLDWRSLVGYFAGIFDRAAIRKIMMVNTDLLIRTVCLLAMTNLFMAKGSSFSKDMLAANAVLFQIQYLIAYAFDGFANGASVFAGKAFGERNREDIKKIFAYSDLSFLLLSCLLTVLIMVFSVPLIEVFTSIDAVVQRASEYIFWLYFFPSAIGIGLLYYGIFNGCTLTGAIRNSMIFSLCLFMAAYFLLIPPYGNHGLWAAFLLFSLGRSLFLLFFRKTLVNHFSRD